MIVIVNNVIAISIITVHLLSLAWCPVLVCCLFVCWWGVVKLAATAIQGSSLHLSQMHHVLCFVVATCKHL